MDTPTLDEYQNNVPLDLDEVRTNQSSSASLGPAIPNANGLKASGSHILAIGVGSALQNQSSVDRLIAMSGPDVFDGTGAFDISTDDVTLDLSSVAGVLTTPPRYEVPLEVGEEYLNADFGVVLEDDLPFTGFEVVRLVVIALSLLVVGAGVVAVARDRRQQGA